MPNEPTADPDDEWRQPDAIELQWVHMDTGEILGPSVPGYLPTRAAWVARYGNRWVEVFPGGSEYARPN